MKSENETKNKSTIQELRKIRDEISKETQDMNYEELQKYIVKSMKDSIHKNVKWKSNKDE